MDKNQFTAAYVAAYLAAAAVHDDTAPGNQQPVSGAVMLANEAWEQIQNVLR